MRNHLLIPMALLMLTFSVSAIAQTSSPQTLSPTNPQQRHGVTGNDTQTPPTLAEQERCNVLVTEPERVKCLSGVLPPGTPSLTQNPQPAPMQQR